MIPVQYIISTEQKLSLLAHVETALNAGCKWISLRIEGEVDDKLTKTAKKIKEICREHDATFIIEDNIDLVKNIDGDGVHITSDTSLITVRQQIGEGFLIGANASCAEDIITKKRQSADYICCGPYQPANGQDNQQSGTISSDAYKNIIDTIEANDTFVPVSAFGNINVCDVEDIINAGVRAITIHIPNKDITKKEVESTLKAFLDL